MRSSEPSGELRVHRARWRSWDGSRRSARVERDFAVLVSSDCYNLRSDAAYDTGDAIEGAMHIDHFAGIQADALDPAIAEARVRLMRF